jgi:hypothetical protein
LTLDRYYEEDTRGFSVDGPGAIGPRLSRIKAGESREGPRRERGIDSHIRRAAPQPHHSAFVPYAATTRLRDYPSIVARGKGRGACVARPRPSTSLIWEEWQSSTYLPIIGHGGPPSACGLPPPPARRAPLLSSMRKRHPTPAQGCMPHRTGAMQDCASELARVGIRRLDAHRVWRDLHSTVVRAADCKQFSRTRPPPSRLRSGRSFRAGRGCSGQESQRYGRRHAEHGFVSVLTGDRVRLHGLLGFPVAPGTSEAQPSRLKLRFQVGFLRLPVPSCPDVDTRLGDTYY